MTYLPSSHGFVDAARLGLGWGMVPEQMVRPAIDAGELVEIAPGRGLDVPLYWQRWRLDSPVLAALTGAVTRAAAAALSSRPTGRASGRWTGRSAFRKRLGR